jgi:GNAT superfamily N-acetyltransferase
MAWVVVARRRYPGGGGPLADPDGPGVGAAAEPAPEQAARMAATATAAIHLDIARSIVVAPPKIDPTASGRYPSADGFVRVRRVDSSTMATPPAIQVKPLTPDRFADLAQLFEEGGDPKWCWCIYFRVRGRDWSNSTATDNRDELRALTKRKLAPGLVAYREGGAVGWVSLGPRTDYERLAYSKVLAPVDDRPVWSIVCFVVSRTARGTGIAGRLLDAGIDYAREHGASTLEAYPVEIADGKRIPAADAYHGALSTFTKAGFTVVERRQWNKTSPVRPIVRLDL